MSKQIFHSEKPNSFRLKAEQAEILNLYAEEFNLEKVGEVVWHLILSLREAQRSKPPVNTIETPPYIQPGLIELKKEVEAALPALYPTSLAGVNKVEITVAEMILLMVDYCKRDPSGEFPFGDECERIIARYKVKPNDTTRKGETEEGEGTAGRGDKTATEAEGGTGEEEGGIEPITTPLFSDPTEPGIGDTPGNAEATH